MSCPGKTHFDYEVFSMMSDETASEERYEEIFEHYNQIWKNNPPAKTIYSEMEESGALTQLSNKLRDYYVKLQPEYLAQSVVHSLRTCWVQEQKKHEEHPRQRASSIQNQTVKSSTRTEGLEPIRQPQFKIDTEELNTKFDSALSLNEDDSFDDFFEDIHLSMLSEGQHNSLLQEDFPPLN